MVGMEVFGDSVVLHCIPQCANNYFAHLSQYQAEFLTHKENKKEMIWDG